MLESQKVAVVIGGSSGIGLALTNRLLKDNYKVYAVGRTFDDAFSEEAKAVFPIFCLQSDLSDLKSISKVLRIIHDEIDLLVFSAGIVLPERTMSEQGLDVMFQVNYLSNLVINDMLSPSLRPDGTTVFVVSEEHKKADVDLNDPMMTKGKYKPRKLYQNTKLFQIAYAKYLDDQLDYESDKRILAIHPGTVNTGFGGRHLTGLKKWFWELYGTFREGISAGEAADNIMKVLGYDRNNLKFYYNQFRPGEYADILRDETFLNQSLALSKEIISNLDK